jgi:3',5'-cyclic AMP phosphodiesterase CpdA
VEAVRFYAGRPTADRVFSLGVIPDTQQEVLRSGDRRFEQRSDWLVGTKSALDLKFVTHTGDIVNWDTPDHVQYRRAATALKPLAAGKVPYSLSPGNHDTGAVCAGGGACDPKETRTLVRQTASMNRFLGDGTAALGGRYQAGKVDNTYSLFRAGGSQWLVLNLELWPRKEVVAWAERVVASHPDRNVIVVTHSYLTAGGAIYQSSGYGGVSPQYLFDHLVKVYPNVRVVLSGHTGKAVTRTDVGVEGNRIVSLLLTMHDNDTNPLRLVEINTAADTLDTWVYAPFTAQTYPRYSRSFTNMAWID